MKENIIYGLKDPRTDEYKYVGKSVNGVERAKSHTTHSHNPLLNQWVDELKMNNLTPDVVVLEDVFDWKQLIDKEKYWVGKLLNEKHDLFNVLIVDLYNDTMRVYNEKLKKQINERTALLEEKLNKSLMEFGDESNLAELIKRRRKTLHITQQQLAEVTGIGLATIKRIELNEANITFNNLTNVLDVLGFKLLITLR
jgi:DNA-binding transcriptional regulator YiaG